MTLLWRFCGGHVPEMVRVSGKESPAIRKALVELELHSTAPGNEQISDEKFYDTVINTLEELLRLSPGAISPPDKVFHNVDSVDIDIYLSDVFSIFWGVLHRAVALEIGFIPIFDPSPGKRTRLTDLVLRENTDPEGIRKRLERLRRDLAVSDTHIEFEPLPKNNEQAQLGLKLLKELKRNQAFDLIMDKSIEKNTLIPLQHIPVALKDWSIMGEWHTRLEEVNKGEFSRLLKAVSEYQEALRVITIFLGKENQNSPSWKEGRRGITDLDQVKNDLVASLPEAEFDGYKMFNLSGEEITEPLEVEDAKVGVMMSFRVIEAQIKMIDEYEEAHDREGGILCEPLFRDYYVPRAKQLFQAGKEGFSLVFADMFGSVISVENGQLSWRKFDTSIDTIPDDIDWEG